MSYTDSFLRNLDGAQVKILEDLRSEWQISDHVFSSKIENWISNFDNKDKHLAFKVLANIRYVSEPNFTKTLNQLYVPIDKYLYTSGLTNSNVYVITAEQRADSSSGHAYLASKTWRVPIQNVVSVNEIVNILSTDSGDDFVLVSFNDTHGTGRQFLTDIWSILKRHQGKFRVLFVVSVAITQKALSQFHCEFSNANVRVIPEIADRTAADIFTANEYMRLHELGRELYSLHPLGYGESGLLVAYAFQCPNNSLPIIWADGENNVVEGRAAKWNALFPYRPKVKSLPPNAGLDNVEDRAGLVRKKLSAAAWSEAAVDDMLSTLQRWEVSVSDCNALIDRILRWLNNFEETEQTYARKLLSKFEFFSIARTRKMIYELQQLVRREIRASGDDDSSILVISTGHHKPTVYHYLYDFLDIWGLNTSQVKTLEAVRPYDTFGKNLVFFYHTRVIGSHFSDEVYSKIVEKKLSARRIFVLSFASGVSAIKNIQKHSGPDRVIHLRIDAASRTVAECLHDFEPDERRGVADLYKKYAHDDLEMTKLVTAYYFQCPQATSDIFWKSDGAWSGIFQHISRERSK